MGILTLLMIIIGLVLIFAFMKVAGLVLKVIIGIILIGIIISLLSGLV